MANKQLSSTDWATIVTLYERGEKNTRELAEQFGVSQQGISKGLRERGINKNSRLEEVGAEAVDAAREAHIARVRNANSQVDTYSKYYDVLAKLTMKRVIDGDRAGTLSSKNAEVLTIKSAITVVDAARKGQWEVLGIQDLLGEDAELPDLNVGEYSESELDAIREGNEEHYLEGLDDEDEDEEDGALGAG